MKKIIFTTYISSIIAILIAGTYYGLVNESFDFATYFIFLGYFNIIIPNFLAVLIYSGLEKIFKIQNTKQKLIVDIILLGLTLQLCLWTWAVIDVYLDFDNVTFKEVKRDYDRQFRGFNPVTFTLAIIIPGIYLIWNDKPKPKPKPKELLSQSEKRKS